jgi:hypothetical protein
VRDLAGQPVHAADGVDDSRVLYHVVSAHFQTGSLEKARLAALLPPSS